MGRSSSWHATRLAEIAATAKRAIAAYKFATGLTHNSTGLIDYESIFPENKPSKGYPLNVLDPVVIQQGPGMIPQDIGGKLDVLIFNAAQELPYMRIIKNYDELKTLVEPRADSFKPGLYPTILAKYKNATYLPHNCTANCIYQTMTSDILLTCGNNEAFQNLSMIPNYNVFRGIIAQPPSSTNRGPNYAYSFHGWDFWVLFGLRKTLYQVTERERRFRSNLLKVYKGFIHSDLKFYEQYSGKTMVFYNNAIMNLDRHYHEEECKVWKDNGVLKHAWGNRAY